MDSICIFSLFVHCRPFWFTNYLQELKARRSGRKKNSSSYENKEGNSRSFSSTAGLSNIKPGENLARNSALDESGSSNSRKKQSKSFLKQQPSHKPRFFSSNFRNQGSGRNSLGIVSESPPSKSVGYFFGSTPPENHGLVWRDCCLCLTLLILFLRNRIIWLAFWGTFLLRLRAKIKVNGKNIILSGRVTIYMGFFVQFRCLILI